MPCKSMPVGDAAATGLLVLCCSVKEGGEEGMYSCSEHRSTNQSHRKTKKKASSVGGGAPPPDDFASHRVCLSFLARPSRKVWMLRVVSLSFRLQCTAVNSLGASGNGPFCRKYRKTPSVAVWKAKTAVRLANNRPAAP